MAGLIVAYIATSRARYRATLLHLLRVYDRQRYGERRVTLAVRLSGSVQIRVIIPTGHTVCAPAVREVVIRFGVMTWLLSWVGAHMQAISVR